jgi:hypothetical protein
MVSDTTLTNYPTSCVIASRCKDDTEAKLWLLHTQVQANMIILSQSMYKVEKPHSRIGRATDDGSG